MKSWKNSPQKLLIIYNQQFVSLPAGLPRKPISGRNRNFLGSRCLLSTISLIVRQANSQYWVFEVLTHHQLASWQWIWIALPSVMFSCMCRILRLRTTLTNSMVACTMNCNGSILTITCKSRLNKLSIKPFSNFAIVQHNFAYPTQQHVQKVDIWIQLLLCSQAYCYTPQ